MQRGAADERSLRVFVVIYRWRLHADHERAFVQAWTRATIRLRDERGALGSQLHRGNDGLWYAYAQWPSSAAREASIAQGPIDAEASATFRLAIAETLPEILLEPVADFPLPLTSTSGAD